MFLRARNAIRGAMVQYSPRKWRSAYSRPTPSMCAMSTAFPPAQFTRNRVWIDALDVDRDDVVAGEERGARALRVRPQGLRERAVVDGRVHPRPDRPVAVDVGFDPADLLRAQDP